MQQEKETPSKVSEKDWKAVFKDQLKRSQYFSRFVKFTIEMFEKYGSLSMKDYKDIDIRGNTAYRFVKELSNVGLIFKYWSPKHDGIRLFPDRDDKGNIKLSEFKETASMNTGIFTTEEEIKKLLAKKNRKINDFSDKGEGKT
jgi:hypothetical protein